MDPYLHCCVPMWQQAGLKERKDEVNYAWKHGVEPPEQLTSGAFVRDNSSLISVTSGFMDCNGWWAGRPAVFINDERVGGAL